MQAGWTRWLFDEYELPYDTLKDARVLEGDLREDYDVILFQTQEPASISGARTKAQCTTASAPRKWSR